MTKKANLIAILNVPDDFEEGKCSICPLGDKSYFENHQYMEETVNCKIGFTPLTCPLVVKHINR